ARCDDLRSGAPQAGGPERSSRSLDQARNGHWRGDVAACSRGALFCPHRSLWTSHANRGPRSVEAELRACAPILLDRARAAGAGRRFDAAPVLSVVAFLAELWIFLRSRKKLVLLPIVIIMLILGLLLVFVQGSVVAPFIYTLF